jgi:hypothetical protein
VTSLAVPIREVVLLSTALHHLTAEEAPWSIACRKLSETRGCR